MVRPVYLCPICDQEMLPTGQCHLVCPSGHYQEVCSDLFPPERHISDNKADSSNAEPDQQAAEAAGED